ncbi:MAG: hypothetical protein HOP16_20135 [Acidobacteria bacterium]|nr:hypothetical protein [Acidobacteriota bacterium]
MPRLRIFGPILLLLAAAGSVYTQGNARRLATVSSLHQYPAYYHLQNVLLHGEFVENGSQTVLRGGERDITMMMNDQRAVSGTVEVRGMLLDVGRLEPSDPRLSRYGGAREPERWPRPGEELVLSVTGVAETQLATSPSIRGLALQPWRFDGQKVTVVGQFRGRNLFGDLPSAPGKSRYDFVLRSADAALWVTDLRPRGRGFDLSVDAKVDTGRWLQVSGTVVLERGLVTMLGTTVATSAAPDVEPPQEEEPAPPAPLETAEMIFSSPTDGDMNVPLGGSVRFQFSRGLDPASIDGQIRVTYVGTAPADAAGATLEFKHAYDLGTRAIEIRFAAPLDRFRTVKVELLDGMKAFDGAPVAPSSITFSTGG